MHHKRRATTSGSLATPPFGSLFPSPRGVGKAFRWGAIRIGFGRFTTEDDVDFAVDKIAGETERLRRTGPRRETA